MRAVCIWWAGGETVWRRVGRDTYVVVGAVSLVLLGLWLRKYQTGVTSYFVTDQFPSLTKDLSITQRVTVALARKAMQ